MSKSMSLTNRSMLSALGANAIFGFSFLFTKVALEYASPYVLLVCRFGIALLVFSLFIFIGKARLNLRGKPWKYLLLLGLFQPVLYFVGETYGVLYTTASFSAIMIALIPIASLWASALILKESPTARQSFFCCLSVVGVILVTASTNTGSNQLKGVIFLLVAVIADVAFNLTTRKLSQQFTAFERTFVMFCMGFAIFSGMMLVETGGSFLPVLAAFQIKAFLLPIVYLGIASSVVAFFLINYANTYLPVTRTVVFINVTTIISILGGAVFLHERLTTLSIFAVAIILLGIWGVQRYARKETAEPSQLEDL